jgi:hypothetical protein
VPSNSSDPIALIYRRRVSRRAFIFARRRTLGNLFRPPTTLGQTFKQEKNLTQSRKGNRELTRKESESTCAKPTGRPVRHSVGVRDGGGSLLRVLCVFVVKIFRRKIPVRPNIRNTAH